MEIELIWTDLRSKLLYEMSIVQKLQRLDMLSLDAQKTYFRGLKPNQIMECRYFFELDNKQKGGLSPKRIADLHFTASHWP